MGMKMGILFLLVLVTSWACADANRMLISDVSLMQASNKEPKREAQPSKAEVENEVCTMCEQLTTTALDYLGQNETQTKIINALHMACYGLHSFKHQCITMVDYYGHLFFVKISTIQPQDICEKVNLCDELLIAPSQYQNVCGFCHFVITQVMAKLKDPDTQMDIISSLLKGCDAVEKYATQVRTRELMQQCKEVVLEYGPIVMINAEQFLEKAISAPPSMSVGLRTLELNNLHLRPRHPCYLNHKFAGEKGKEISILDSMASVIRDLLVSVPCVHRRMQFISGIYLC